MAVPTGPSGVTGFQPDFVVIIQEACERAGYDFTESYAIRTAKRSCDFLMMQWANKGLNLWTIDEQTTALTAGTATYLLPTDTVDLVFPSIRTIVGGKSQDIVMVREDFTDYASIPDKTTQGRPSVVYVQRMAAQPKAYLWLVPDAVTAYTLVWWRLRRMMNTGAPTNSPDMPFRLVPALTSGLAWQMALKKKIKDYNLITILKMQYDQDMDEATREDRDRSNVFIVPDDSYRL